MERRARAERRPGFCQCSTHEKTHVDGRQAYVDNHKQDMQVPAAGSMH